MDGILQLSKVSSGTTTVVNIESRSIEPIFLIAMTQLISEDCSALSALRVMASVLLLRARTFIEEAPESWEPCLQGSGSNFHFDRYTFIDPMLNRAWHGCIALIARTGTFFQALYVV
jgi:hypothetical protein